MEASRTRPLTAPAARRGAPGRLVAGPLLRLRSDEQLVRLFRAGNEDAFRTIHDRFRARLLAYARQMLGGSRADAEDVLQDVFVRAYGALRANEREVSLRAWLYRIAHNRCVDELRRPVESAGAPPDALERVEARAGDPVTTLERRESLRRLVQDVQRLPEQQRSALLMRELSGMPYQELAAALDVTVPAVKSLLVRARVGLAHASEAREAACAAIRADLADAHERGVRASGLVRRHLHDCAPCRAYRRELKSVDARLAALMPTVGPLALVAKLLGVGGGAGAGGGAAAAASSGGAIVAGGGAAAGAGGLAAGAAGVSASHVAVAMAVAAVGAGGAIEARRTLSPEPRPAPVVRAAQGASTPAVDGAVAHGPAQLAVPAVLERRASRRPAATKPLRLRIAAPPASRARDRVAPVTTAPAPTTGDQTAPAAPEHGGAAAPTGPALERSAATPAEAVPSPASAETGAAQPQPSHPSGSATSPPPAGLAPSATPESGVTAVPAKSDIASPAPQGVAASVATGGARVELRLR